LRIALLFYNLRMSFVAQHFHCCAPTYANLILLISTVDVFYIFENYRSQAVKSRLCWIIWREPTNAAEIFSIDEKIPARKFRRTCQVDAVNVNFKGIR
jgi:hypothetical protein